MIFDDICDILCVVCDRQLQLIENPSIETTAVSCAQAGCHRTCLIVCFVLPLWLILSLSQRVAMCDWRGILRQSGKLLKIQAAAMSKPHDTQTSARFLKQFEC